MDYGYKEIGKGSKEFGSTTRDLRSENE
ncbi:hypothetical protein CCACVL1_24739 [Corchorus capsularis]|uniref:Uncharacterized protein n=1 Tax=Corchorus capsularis TaxID=210143 RepID=A0A1R3GND8_COCAP|nr:hypothetical protein CCACVL1_24739 [Corchorus capsularis]